MADKENVITHLMIIHSWAELARERNSLFFTSKHLEDIARWSDDAIDMLKEQDAEISRISNAYLELVGKASKQPKVVRCKDCKHGKTNPCKEYTTCFLEHSCLYGNTRKSDWFCADGERK